MSSCRGVCKSHYSRLRKTGDLQLCKHLGGYGKGHISPDGYRVVFKPGHPNVRSKTGHILQHRLVMSDAIGRALLSQETVHHVNGDRLDNRIENLELWSTNNPRGQRVVDKVEWATELLRKYAPERVSRQWR